VAWNDAGEEVLARSASAAGGRWPIGALLSILAPAALVIASAQELLMPNIQPVGRLIVAFLALAHAFPFLWLARIARAHGARHWPAIRWAPVAALSETGVLTAATARTAVTPSSYGAVTAAEPYLCTWIVAVALAVALARRAPAAQRPYVRRRIRVGVVGYAAALALAVGGMHALAWHDAQNDERHQLYSSNDVTCVSTSRTLWIGYDCVRQG
jgi:hypothetical protein